MDAYTASAGTIGSAAHGIGALASRVHAFQRSNDDVTRSLSDAGTWGLLRPLRDDFLSLSTEFKRHLGHMSGAIDGAKKRLHSTAANYSAAEAASLEILAETGNRYGAGQKIRELNPAAEHGGEPPRTSRGSA